MSDNENNISQSMSDDEKMRKLQSLQEMISTAEKTIHSAKAMLLQIEGKKKSGRPRLSNTGGDGNVVEGTFDGQIMLGTDGKQYPVPANYASKSKLVEGDYLKLTITPEGSFIYKQIGPVDRHNLIGIVSQDENGNYYVMVEGKAYKLLLASVTYFKAEPGDEVVIVVPQNTESSWAALENVLQHSRDENPSPKLTAKKTVLPKERNDAETIAEEWAPDIKEIEKEIQKEMHTAQEKA